MRYFVFLFFMTIMIVENCHSQENKLKFESLLNKRLNQEQVNFSIFNFNKIDTISIENFSEFQISSVTYKKKYIGDFNKNGKQDVFAKMKISYSKHNNSYIYGLIEFTEKKINIVQYFTDDFSGLKLDYETISVHNDTITFTNNVKYSNYDNSIGHLIDEINRKTSIVYSDSIKSYKIISPCKFDKMLNTNIFKDSIDAKRTLGTNRFLLFKEQKEVFENDKMLLKLSVSGCDELILRTYITFKNEEFNWKRETLSALEYLQTNTRFRTIFTRIEKKMQSMNVKGEIYYKNEPYIINKKERFKFDVFKRLNRHSIKFTYYINSK